MVSKVTYRKTKYIIPLTDEYNPRPYMDGTIIQTTRSSESDYQIGDMIMFHTWDGKAYASKWKEKSPRYMVIDKILVTFTDASVALRDVATEEIYVGHAYKWEDMDWYAEQEALAEPTHASLKKLFYRRFENKDKSTYNRASLLRLRLVTGEYEWKGKYTMKRS